MHALYCARVLTLAALIAQSYPPAYPRPGTAKLFENARVVVWNIAWLKGQPSPLHRHIYDLVGVYYAPGDRMIIAVDGSKRPVSTKAGDIAFQLKGITHIEEGTSDSPLRAVFVEMKDEGPSGRASDVPALSERSNSRVEGPPPFAEIGAKSLLDNDRVAVWSYGLGAQNPRHRHARDAVVVWLEGGTPHALFVPAGTVHALEQAGVAAQATVFEIK
jgi:predicted metal-dependent enzyme (double-stranded beta helix superfamily)